MKKWHLLDKILLLFILTFGHFAPVCPDSEKFRTLEKD